MTDEYVPPPPPSAADHAYHARKAAGRRADFLREHDLIGIAADEFAIVGMCRSLRESWNAHQIDSVHTRRDVAMSALSRVSSRYASPASPFGLFRVAFGSAYGCYARTGSTKPAMVSTHADELGPDQLRELADFAASGFEVRALPERWASRMGFRILVANPTRVRIYPRRELDDELRPGPSHPQPHVRLRGSRTGDPARTSSHEPVIETHS